MSVATSVVPEAIASSRTRPNDSPPRDGSTAIRAPASSPGSASLLTRPSNATRARTSGVADATSERSADACGPSPSTCSRTSSRCAAIRRNAFTATSAPLRCSSRPRKTIRITPSGAGVSAATGRSLRAAANRATSTPLGTMAMSSTSSPSARAWNAAATGLTAVNAAARAMMLRPGARTARYRCGSTPPSAEAWNVATTGASAPSTVAGPTSGTSGSWTWTTSGPSRSSTDRTRVIDRGSSAMGARDPLAGTDVDAPRPLRPGPGAPGPMTWTSSPSARSATASASTWTCTPPATERS